jgi:hypothetical protein
LVEWQSATIVLQKHALASPRPVLDAPDGLFGTRTREQHVRILSIRVPSVEAPHPADYQCLKPRVDVCAEVLWESDPRVMLAAHASALPAHLLIHEPVG